MFWQKDMSFLKCFSFESKNVIHLELCELKNKASNCNLQLTKSSE